MFKEPHWDQVVRQTVKLKAEVGLNTSFSSAPTWLPMVLTVDERPGRVDKMGLAVSLVCSRPSRRRSVVFLWGKPGDARRY